MDLGTSSVRAIVFDRRLRPVPGTAAYRAHSPRLSADGGAEMETRLVLRQVAEVIDEALRGVGDEPVTAVGVSTFWHGLVAAGPDLKPLSRVLLWSDGRSWPQAERLRRRLDESAVHRRTGCRLHPSYWPSKIAWLRGQSRRLAGSATRWLSPTDLLYQRLFGDLATSSSVASATGLRRLRTPAWDGELLDAIGIEASSLPEVRDEPWQGPRAPWRRRWPQLAGAVWAPPAGDGGLANLGSGCLDQSRRALTIGTSGALRVLTRRAPTRLPPELWCYRADASRHVVGGALSNGGNLHAWLLDVLADPDSRRESRLPGEHGLTFLPLLAGERGPGYALRARGAIAGLTQATTATDILQAGMEAVAVQFARLDRDLDRVAPGATLTVASGAGLLANPGWMGMLADALDRPVGAGRAGEASARGAAFLAFEAAGILDESDLDRLDPGTDPPVVPRRDPKVRGAYRDALRRQEALYEVLVRGRLLESSGAHVPAHLWRSRGRKLDT